MLQDRMFVAGALLMLLSCASSLSCASPFVNLTPDAELAALRPVAPLESPLQDANTTNASALPALVLNFAPEEIDRNAKLHFADVWDRIRAGFALPAIDTMEAA
jgi:hypothetical protein